MKREAIILAGGFGTRLSKVVKDVPKPMAPIAGRPFLEILLDTLSANHFTHVILSLGYMAEVIQSHFGDSYNGIAISYEVETTPLGTGGAVRAALQHCKSDHVYVFNGDTFLDLDVSAVEDLWERNHNPVIVSKHMDDVSRYGSLMIQNDRLIKFIEKGKSGAGFINAGCYVLPTDQLSSFNRGTAFSLEQDYFEKELDKLTLDVYTTEGAFIDIGVPEDYELAQTMLVEY